MTFSLAWGPFISATGGPLYIITLSVITAMERPFMALIL